MQRRNNNNDSNTSNKFKGACEELEGHYFDCSDYKQADKYTTTVKRLADYVGSHYKYGGDIRATLENKAEFIIAEPRNPVQNNTKEEDIPKLAKLVFDKEVDACVKRKSILQENIQKSCSLVLGQSTPLMKSMLKSGKKWDNISQTQHMLRLLDGIKSITFKFEE